MTVKVSVIIPVYNAERDIEECIQSLLKQTLQHCEFIFINDGSTDNSIEIIRKYQKYDQRIILINQENQGVSIARNTGLINANGEYVGFVDADDYINNDMLERLYKSAREDNYDVVISNFESEIAGYKVVSNYPFTINKKLNKDYIKNKILPYFLAKDDLNTVCSKLYKNRVVKDNRIIFPEKVTLGEDGIYNILFFSNSNLVKYIDYTGYHYREVEGSATRNIAEKDYFSSSIEVFKMDMPKIFLEQIDTDKVNNLKATKLINSVFSYIHIYFTPSKSVGFLQRYNYVKKMISNNYVRESLILYHRIYYETLGSYQKMLLILINKKSALGLYWLTNYSRFRNKR
jgi:glycosyltransferase involved in cell wall biosynthesis